MKNYEKYKFAGGVILVCAGIGKAIGSILLEKNPNSIFDGFAVVVVGLIFIGDSLMSQNK